MSKTRHVLFPIMCLLLAVLSTFADESDECPNIIKRSEWGGLRPKAVYYVVTPLPYVVIHHTATPNCLNSDGCSERVRNIQSYHMNELGWSDVGYSFFIGGDGNVYEGVGWSKEGAHTYGWNKKSAGIVFIGNFQDVEPSEKMLNATRKLIDCGKSDGSLREDVKIMGGRQLITTLSPGNKLYNRIKNWPDWISSP